MAECAQNTSYTQNLVSSQEIVPCLQGGQRIPVGGPSCRAPGGWNRGPLGAARRGYCIHAGAAE